MPTHSGLLSPVLLLLENCQANLALLSSKESQPIQLIALYENTICALKTLKADHQTGQLNSLSDLLKALTNDLTKRVQLLRGLASINLKVANEATIDTYNEAKSQCDYLLENSQNNLTALTKLKKELNPNMPDASNATKALHQEILKITTSFDTSLKEICKEITSQRTDISASPLTSFYNAWLKDLATYGSHIALWKDPSKVEQDCYRPPNHSTLFQPQPDTMSCSSSDADNDPPPIAPNDFNDDYPSSP